MIITAEDLGKWASIGFGHRRWRICILDEDGYVELRSITGRVTTVHQDAITEVGTYEGAMQVHVQFAYGSCGEYLE